MELAIIIVFCVAGCGIHSYFLGRRHGIIACAEYLEDMGIIELDNEEDDFEN